jgi:FecR protein
VSYFQMHTDLQFAARAQRAASAVLERVIEEETSVRSSSPSELSPNRRRPPAHLYRWSSLAAGVLIAVGSFALGVWGRTPRRPPQKGSEATVARSIGANVAWLVNAQNCQWAENQAGMPGRDMHAGKSLQLIRGLAEIEFERGTRLILQGPAGLELISGNEARLIHGALTARVPERARGFTIYSPRGKVVDLGTEFGLSVDDRGNTAVRVFEGKVVASPKNEDVATAPSLTLHEDQAARIEVDAVALRPRGGDDSQFVRAIVPPPVVTPRIQTLDFRSAIPNSLRDRDGRGIGLTHRLPGTGESLLQNDANLRLDVKRGALELTTTRSDINTQVGMGLGEYLGVALSDLGFTGTEDFAVSATIPNIPGLQSVGQFGLYAGSRSDQNIRGGLISPAEPDRYTLFLVNNDGGRDKDLYEVGLMSTGDDLRLTLRRVAGFYSLLVENLTRKSASTLSISHPTHLDGVRDVYVGVFGANAQSDVRKTLTIKEIDVRVWTVLRTKTRAWASSTSKDRAMN